MKRTNIKQCSIDWESVRNRLRASENALEEALAPNARRIEDAYRRRAARLANGQAEREPLSAGLPVVVFRLAQERYAVEMKDLAEVLPFARCAPVPGAPRPFLGVINVRGELRAVLDLSRLMVPSASGDGDSGFVLMMRRPGREIGLKVDRIEELCEIRAEELSLPAQGKYVKGIAAGTLMLLSVDAVLAEVFSKEESLIT